MPELPDVEILRQYASGQALNKEIERIEYPDDQVLESSKQKISGYLKGMHFLKSIRLEKMHWKWTALNLRS